MYQFYDDTHSTSLKNAFPDWESSILRDTWKCHLEKKIRTILLLNENFGQELKHFHCKLMHDLKFLPV